ncbi:MAG TPA: hypothetical protein VKQ36_11975 [Ktedonobacterales bacterium]|nr:hypothetical protein [Ktedonobacterales bacterium]
MATRIYVGNLPYTADNEQLAELFHVFGPVIEAAIVYDRTSGQSKGFGFVQMASEEAAQQAIAALNGTMFGNRTIRVNEAQERTYRPSDGRGGYGGGRDGGYGGGGRGGGYSSGGYNDRPRRDYSRDSGGFGRESGYGRSSGGYGGGRGYNDRPRRDEGYSDGGYGGGRGGYRDSGGGYNGGGYNTYTQPSEDDLDYDRRIQGRERDRARREREW